MGGAARRAAPPMCWSNLHTAICSFPATALSSFSSPPVVRQANSAELRIVFLGDRPRNFAGLVWRAMHATPTRQSSF